MLWAAAAGRLAAASTPAAAAPAVTAPAVVAAPAVTAPAAPLAVKVMVINLFGFEAAPWLAALKPDREIPVPGLSAEYPAVHCDARAVCQMTTDMGHANAAASVMAVLLSRQFDLRRTYFLVAGIAGIDPERGTIGTAAWARYVVDSGIAHELDRARVAEGLEGGLLRGVHRQPRHATEIRISQRALPARRDAAAETRWRCPRDVALEDDATVAAYRRHYHDIPAGAAPRVSQCDTLSGDTWWAGNRLGEHARHWTRLLTDGKGVYCTTQQEDNAVLAALTRGARANRADVARVAVLRSGVDFDRPYPGQTALESLQAQRSLQGAGRIAVDNLVRTGMPLVDAIAGHWDVWQAAVPPVAARPRGRTARRPAARGRTARRNTLRGGAMMADRPPRLTLRGNRQALCQRGGQRGGGSHGGAGARFMRCWARTARARAP